MSSPRSDRLILVVDDDPDVRGLVELLLVDEGYRVVTARDGREALEQVEQEMPSLILLDMKMPVMDGWEFARRLRSQHPNHPPIVAVTAAQDAPDRARQISAAGSLAKPFEVDELLRLVGAFVAASRS